MALSRQLEIERKYDVEVAAKLPSLAGVPRVTGIDDRGVVELNAAYYDTEDGTLQRHGITLRSRRGGKDEGWHTKFPAEHGRLEVHLPLRKDHDGVPPEVEELVRVHVRGRALRPVATMKTLRAVTVILGAKGRELAEVSDDTVEAHNVASGEDHSWREWEVELLDTVHDSKDDQATLLDDVEHRLLETGATRAQRASKLARVLGRAEEAGTADGPEVGGKSVRAVLTEAFRLEAAQLKSWDPRVRRDEEDSVHQLRVSARAIRSMLKTFKPVLDAERADALAAQMQELGRILGTARDAEVTRDHVAERVALQPAGLVLKQAANRLRRAKEREYRAAHDKVLEELNSPAYFVILDALDDFIAHVPLKDGDGDGGSAAKELAACFQRQTKRVMRMARDAEACEDPDEQLTLLHDVRKKSKRLRYAIRSVSGAPDFTSGKRLKKLMNRAEKVQDALGAHRDSQMFQQFLRSTAKEARKAGEDTFGYGVLYAAEVPIQEKAEKAYAKSLSKLRY
jgi:CHAD domain-containing protein